MERIWTTELAAHAGEVATGLIYVEPDATDLERRVAVQAVGVDHIVERRGHSVRQGRQGVARRADRHHNAGSFRTTDVKLFGFTGVLVALPASAARSGTSDCLSNAWHGRPAPSGWR